MHLRTTLFSLLATAGVLAHPKQPAGSACLSDSEALHIATQYLQLYDTGHVTNFSQVASVLSSNITSYDETGSPYGNTPTTTGSQAFFESVTGSGPSAYTNATQKPLFVMHSCDQIAYRWQFQAFSTGYDSTVPAGTYLEFKGNDIVQVDLSTRLIFNATSSGDWINLARELGQVKNVTCSDDPTAVACIA